MNNKIVKIDRYKTDKTPIYWALGYYCRVVFSKINFFVMILFSLLILVKNKDLNNNIITKNVMRIAAPQIFVMNTLNNIFVGTGNLMTFFYKIKQENVFLKQENFNLKQKMFKFENIFNENQQLKILLQFLNNNSIEKYEIIALDIINRNIFSNKIGINHGVNNNLSENNLVIDLNGNVIGKLINVKDNNAEILLITDPKARFTLRTEDSKINFISSGNGNKFLNINYIVGEEYNLKEGEFVYTNDKNGSDFLIGILVKDNNKFKVKIAIDFNKINYGIIII